MSPPYVFLPLVKTELRPEFHVAAQNCWVKKGGAFTGEVRYVEVPCCRIFVDSFWFLELLPMYDFWLLESLLIKWFVRDVATLVLTIKCIY